MIRHAFMRKPKADQELKCIRRSCSSIPAFGKRSQLESPCLNLSAEGCSPRVAASQTKCWVQQQSRSSTHGGRTREGPCLRTAGKRSPHRGILGEGHGYLYELQSEALRSLVDLNWPEDAVPTRVCGAAVPLRHCSCWQQASGYRLGPAHPLQATAAVNNAAAEGN